MMNKGVVYALWDYEAQNSDELSFHEGDALTILRRKDESETEWWWARLGDREGYVPKNLLGVSTQVTYGKLAVRVSVQRVVLSCCGAGEGGFASLSLSSPLCRGGGAYLAELA